MKLTRKLLARLNRPFNTDPEPFVALRVDYDGQMTWTVAEGVLTFAVTGGSGASLSYDLSAVTLSQIVGSLAAQRGYTVGYLDPERAGLSGLVLMDGTGTPSQSNGNALFGYTSLLWGLFESFARPLQAAADQIPQAIGQLCTKTASGAWLDLLGSYFKVIRRTGELDPQYGPRIAAEVVRPMSNNIAIEAAIEEYTGQACTVDDVTIYQGVFPVYDGTIHYDAAYNYNTVGTPHYGLFDVSVVYDLLNGGDISDFLAAVQSIVARVRAAGTHLRALALGGGTPLSDDFTPPTDTVSTLHAGAAFTETATAPTETFAPMFGALAGFSDTLTAPSDVAVGQITQILRAADGTPLTDSTGTPLLAGVGDLFV